MYMRSILNGINELGRGIGMVYQHLYIKLQGMNMCCLSFLHCFFIFQQTHRCLISKVKVTYIWGSHLQIRHKIAFFQFIIIEYTYRSEK